MFEKLFKLSAVKTTVRTELVAGLTTFMTMAYILAVNPNILSQAGIPRGGVFVATCLAAFVGTMLMAFMSNYPFALAPGMGLNAFLTFGVCFGMGYSWQFALFAVFVEGLVFLALSLTPVREGIFNCIPFSLKKAVAAGIGLFICFIALQTSKIIVNNDAVLVGIMSFKNAAFHTQGICALLAILGTILTGVMMTKGVKGAILYGIFLTWGLGMLCQATGVYVPDPTKGYFSLYPSLTFAGIKDSFVEFKSTCCAVFDPNGWTHKGDAKMGWALVKGLDFFVVMFAFFFVDLFDTLGTLIGVSMKGGFLTKEGKLPRISGALCADAIATSVGASASSPARSKRFSPVRKRRRIAWPSPSLPISTKLLPTRLTRRRFSASSMDSTATDLSRRVRFPTAAPARRAGPPRRRMTFRRRFGKRSMRCPPSPSKLSITKSGTRGSECVVQ